ncbi:MAG: aminotransferase class V-fold PLP-dependent enzyme [Chitinispirillaceae bacterium]
MIHADVSNSTQTCEFFDINTIRADFPALRTSVNGKPLVYLDNAATTHKPSIVLQSILSFYTETNSNIHRGVHHLSEQASESYENARKKVQSFIRADKAEEIIFTRGTTESINLVAHSFGEAFVKEGDEIIVTEMEHHSNLVPWQSLCSHRGAVLNVLPINDHGCLHIDQLQKLMTKRTRLIAICHVSNSLGVINPVKGVIAQAHENNIPVLIDGAQAAAHLPVDVQELDCDFYAISGHKMFAETGVGVLYGKESWLEKMPPYQSGGGMIESVHIEKTTFARPPFRFEAGTPNICGAISLDAAIDYLTSLSHENIVAHEKEILTYARHRLAEIPGLTLYGPENGCCSALSFTIDGINAYDAALLLDKQGIAVRSGMHCAQPVMDHFNIPGTIRVSFALYNTKEEIDTLVRGVQKTINILK